MPDQEPRVSVDVVASHAGIAKDTVHRWIEPKGLPAHRIGRLWKPALSEVGMTVFAGGVDMKTRLLNAFQGTAGSGCFDQHTINSVSPAPNSDRRRQNMIRSCLQKPA
jgi:excisionase family DNA binding protein